MWGVWDENQHGAIHMNVIGAIVGGVFALVMLAMYGAMAISALGYVLKFLSSPLGKIAVQAGMLIAVVYFISKNIKESGMLKTFRDIFFSSEKLYISFWIYFISLRRLVEDTSMFVVSHMRDAAAIAIIANTILFYLLGLSTIITAFKAKSFGRG